MKKIITLCFGSIILGLLSCNPNTEKTNEFTHKLDTHTVKLTVLSDNIFRVQKFSSNTRLKHNSIIIDSTAFNASAASLEISKEETDEAIVIKTSELIIELAKTNGLLNIKNIEGNQLLAEKNTSIKADSVSKDFSKIEVAFHKNQNEAFYGLGQHPEGTMNYNGEKITLIQENKRTAVPFHFSTNNYGILWDNYSKTEYDFTNDNHIITSPQAEQIDYYFIAGQKTDTIISGYRKLTGNAPMFPLWSFGYWQSRERYKTQDELLSVATEFRKKKFPIDLIIQDWQYWGKNPWNAMTFDPDVFPQPQQMVDYIHDSLNMKFMIVVWPRFGQGSGIYNELKNNNLLLPDPDSTKVFYPRKKPQKGQMRHLKLSAYYDPFNPQAREKYWERANDTLFSKNIDAWWLDSPEPLLHGKENYEDYQTHLGPATYHRNTYPLMHSKGMYEGQRRTTSDKRVVLLARSAFAGSQTYSVVAWSGDIDATWSVFHNQIVAGVNFSMSGIPYWTTDIGGFFLKKYKKDANTSDEYNELYTRWFQYGAFCPIFRSHGTNSPREPWLFNPETEKILLKYTNLRYRLLPYIYATAWQVTANDYTMMRGLVMDFKDDQNVYEIEDQFMFGAFFMVCPVTAYKAAKRDVYLPKGADWFDYYTNKKYQGGQNIEADAPIDKMPLFVKAGSIVVEGPEMQYANEKKLDTLDLTVFTGSDCAFTYYMDEGDNYNYEKGKFATIDISWDNKKREITFSEREGSFDGMIEEIQFNITTIDETSTNAVQNPVSYNGNEIKVQL